MNPLSNVMGGWWIWSTQADGTVTLTTECFENIALMLPFTFLLMWTAKEKLLKAKGRQICFTSILWYSTKAAFLFSLTIEFLQLFLRLGTFQLSDLCYNTLGGAMGGVLYWMVWKIQKRKDTHSNLLHLLTLLPPHQENMIYTRHFHWEKAKLGKV